MSAALREQASLASLKQKLDAYSATHGLSHEVQTVVDRRGLVVRVLTDQLLFASGQAALQPEGLPLLDEVAQLLNVDKSHPITVEGHTDNIPISSSRYPSNWELSTDRATPVVRYLIAKGVTRERLGAVGYADLHPIASNATAAGRAIVESGALQSVETKRWRISQSAVRSACQGLPPKAVFGSKRFWPSCR